MLRPLLRALLAVLVLLIGPVPAASAAPNDVLRLLEAGEEASNQEVALRLSRVTAARTDRVVIAREDVFADALGSALLQLDAPLLLVPGKGPLPDDVAHEIRRLGADEAVVLGGEAAIGPDVATDLQDLGVAVTRLAGPSRFDTAVAIARTVPEARFAVLVRGTGDEAVPDRAFADTIAAGPYARSFGDPIVLTAPDTLPAVTADYLAGLDHVTIIGGEAAVSAAVEAQVRDLGVGVSRIAGPDRAATATAIAREYRGGSAADVDHVVLVPGEGPDAWAGGFAATLHAQVRGAPILLSSSTTLPPATQDYLRSSGFAIAAGQQRAPVLTCLVGPDLCDQARALLGTDEVAAGDACTPRTVREDVELLDASTHWAVWWGGQAEDEGRLRDAAADMLRDLERSWATGIEEGDMVLPPGAPTLCQNVELDLTGGGLAADRGPGVGTDEEGYPFLVLTAPIILPLADDPAGPGNPAVAFTAHEAFHILQYNRPGTLYTGENVWWIESSAEWFTRLQHPGDTGALGAVPLYLMSPQIPMWGAAGTVPGSDTTHPVFGGHAYGAGFWLEYLTTEVADPSLVLDAFNRVVPTGQQWLHDDLARRGVDMAEPFGDFAARNATVDWPEEATLRDGLAGWRELTDPAMDFQVAAVHPAPDTGGMVAVPEAMTPYAWGYNSVRIDVDEAATVTVSVAGDAEGSAGTPAAFEVRVVVLDGQDRTYHDLPLVDGEGSVEVDAPADGQVWLSVAATPEVFSGNERFGYRYAVAS